MARFLCNVISYVLKRTVDITVIVPTPTIPQAMRRNKSAESVRHTPKEKYPVLYLLHGGGNNHATWTGYTNVELFAEEQQIAVVNLSAENKSYIKQGHEDFFAFLEEELPDFVCGMFPVSERPEDTYIAGLSMGGYGTLVHALSAPERYAAAGAFSAAVRALPASIDFDPDDKNAVWRRPLGEQGQGIPDLSLDPLSLARKIAEEGRKFPKIYMACGTADHMYSADSEFRRELVKFGADLTWDEIPGYGHEWRFWNIEIERFLNWLPRTDAYRRQGVRKV